MSKPRCTVYRQYCMTHDFVHGAEAEELRSGIEKLIEKSSEEYFEHGVEEPMVSVTALQRLLDRVNARDSLAWLEAEDKTRKGKKRAA